MRKLLIIDDEADLVATLALRLKASGAFEVRTATDPEEGLRLARSWRPDAVLTDVAMPRLDGWELCHRLKADPATGPIRVVLMTAWLSDGLRRQAREAGADWIVLKPFDEGKMGADLERLVETGLKPGETEGGSARALAGQEGES